MEGDKNESNGRWKRVKAPENGKNMPEDGKE